MTTAPERVADVAAGASVAAASVSWISHANEIISLVAGLIAIAAGIPCTPAQEALAKAAALAAVRS